MRENLKNKPTIVYVAVNPLNRKKYIGITCESLRKRMTNHKCNALSQDYMRIFHKAIRKYGFDVFNWYILSKWPSYQEAIDEEKRVIALIKPEYNITQGGEGTLGCKPWLGKKVPYKKRREGTGKNISEALKKSKTLIRKKVICLDTGDIFNSIFEAGEKLNINWTTISKVCNGDVRRKKAGGKSFKFYSGDA